MQARTRFSVLIFSVIGLWASVSVGAIDPSQMLETYNLSI